MMKAYEERRMNVWFSLVYDNFDEIVTELRRKSNDYSMLMLYDDCLTAVLDGGPMISVLAAWNDFRTNANRLEPWESLRLKIFECKKRLRAAVDNPSPFEKRLGLEMTHDTQSLIDGLSQLERAGCGCELNYGVSCGIHIERREIINRARQVAFERTNVT